MPTLTLGFSPHGKPRVERKLCAELRIALVLMQRGGSRCSSHRRSSVRNDEDGWDRTRADAALLLIGLARTAVDFIACDEDTIPAAELQMWWRTNRRHSSSFVPLRHDRSIQQDKLREPLIKQTLAKLADPDRDSKVFSDELRDLR